ncbi:MAG: WbuC family cupin fold metalloprotein [Bacteroidales bacterium]|nr:WbuC family cupin fold metalloprotein [Bacteroidales bacterium]
MIRIDNEIVDKTTTRAKESQRRRMNYNFHPQLDDLLQRMLNAMEPGTYIRPHKHEYPDKTEVFMILRGKMIVIEFDDTGDIKDIELLDSTQGRWAVEIPPRTWHSLISLESGSVAYEIKNGPYNPIDDKNFAVWAPAENSPEAANFLNELTKRCKALLKMD